MYERGHHVAEFSVVRLSKCKIQFSIICVQRIVNPLRGRLWRKTQMLRTNFILSLFHSLERSCSKKCKDRGTQTGHTLSRHENGTSQYIGINLIEHIVFLRNAAGID